MENFKDSASLSAYETKKAHLLQNLQKNNSFVIEKNTASNLFRYQYQKTNKAGKVSLKNFNQIIAIDPQQSLLDVEGLCPYETIVKYTLRHGYLPTVAPELKHITIAGAIAGIGIESTGYKYGFVHDGLVEAEVLLPTGEIVSCNAEKNADLFYALPNSYGTLGYILRAKIKIYPAKSFVRLKSQLYTDTHQLIAAIKTETENQKIQFIEALVFSASKNYLIISTFVSETPYINDIYRSDAFYELIQNKQDIFLTTEDYIFRYDPDWFWNIPNTFFYKLFRKIAPRSLRNSGFYKKYIDTKKKLLGKLGIHSAANKKEEPLIQDWQVPWDKGADLLHFALKNINLEGKPWAIIPILSIEPRTLYPLKPKTLYFNLGCYCYSKKTHPTDSYYNTKIMDAYCYSLGGLKMLYSSTFLSREKFDELYNGKDYQTLKQKYDPQQKFADLYQKAVISDK